MRSLIFFLFLITSNTFAQEKCGVDRELERVKLESPERYSKYMEERAANLEDFKKNGQNFKKSGTTYIIPIVFHIVHNQYNDGKMNAEDILEAIDILNDDFNLRNADTSEIDPQFLPILGDIGFEFRLAQKDPNGDCSTGINYYEHETYYEQGHDNTWSWVQNQWENNWAYNEYLNIYVNDELDGYYGWTYGATTDVWSGVMVADQWVGFGNGSTDNRTLTHEVGHWFSLAHVWGNGNDAGDDSNCDQDDNIDDTPLTKGTYGCDLDRNSCDEGTGDIKDNVQNYMEYGCTIMFTEGQKAAMINSLLNAPGHNGMSSEASLIKTGTQSPYAYNGIGACEVASCSFTNVCNDSLSGSATVKVKGNAPEFDVEWSNGGSATGLEYNGTDTQSDLLPGTYTVTVTDNADLTATCSVEILDSAQISITTLVVDSNECNDCDVSVELNAVGEGLGDPMYFYSNIRSYDGGSNNIRDGVCNTNTSYLDVEPEVSYIHPDENSIVSVCVSITHPNTSELKVGLVLFDEDGGRKYLQLVGREELPAGENITNACFTRDATESIVNGAAPFTGNWMPKHDFTVADHQLVTGMAQERWYLYASDCNDNNQAGTIDLFELTLSDGVDSSIYTWSNSSTDTLLTNICSGTYTITIQDNNKCIATHEVTVNEETVDCEEIDYLDEETKVYLDGSKKLILDSKNVIESVDIYSLEGKLMYSDQPIDNSVDVSSNLPGLYLVTIYTEYGTILRKIVLSN